VKKTSFSIVIAGNMNPAIHHPAWYAAGDLPWFAEEARQSDSDDVLLVTVQASRFKTSNYVIQCTQGVWQITTTSSDATVQGRAVELAASTFARLHETPVTAFGLNAEYRGELSASATDLTRAAGLLKAPPNSGFRAFSFSEKIESIEVSDVRLVRVLNLMVTADQQPAVIQSNLDHRIELPEGASHFELGELLREAVNSLAMVDSRAQDMLNPSA